MITICVTVSCVISSFHSSFMKERLWVVVFQLKIGFLLSTKITIHVNSILFLPSTNYNSMITGSTYRRWWTHVVKHYIKFGLSGSLLLHWYAAQFLQQPTPLLICSPKNIVRVIRVYTYTFQNISWPQATFLITGE